ncbi:hypothetical protein CORC01_01883 [Colletotrichum orchidophilum]|uniref:Uncharacterized protein n=1 Tax=Colletotrichum orchidophilum TaxID=1209926 RepID=A0A1G4BMU1_9PEZI|nr:uncharacterized protein CORC01_01883 [Colletotrichum orchidophilum]OHF02782.1 hypothetical protein CORC01_01883 [Colletotrichum orchidophilum]
MKPVYNNSPVGVTSSTVEFCGSSRQGAMSGIEVSASASASTSAGDDRDNHLWSAKSTSWSAVSAPRNADHDYKAVFDEVEYAFEYIVSCPFENRHGNDSDDNENNGYEDEDHEELSELRDKTKVEEDENNGKGKGETKNTDDEDEDDDLRVVEKQPTPKCDSDKTCLCAKPAAEQPGVPYVITKAGFYKLVNQQIHCQVRAPDSFDMSAYNDHSAFGTLQVLLDLVFNYEEVKGNWREQCVICEAMCPFIWYLSGGDFTIYITGHGVSSFFFIGMRSVTTDQTTQRADGGGLCDQTAKLISNLFLAFLARLECEGIMTGMIKAVNSFRDFLLADEVITYKVSWKRPFPFIANDCDSYVASYAKKHGITLKGVPHLKALLENIDDDEGDPWGWAAASAAYKSGG